VINTYENKTCKNQTAYHNSSHHKKRKEIGIKLKQYGILLVEFKIN